MRAAFCHRSGVIELREVAAPEPAAGEVIVRVRACGVCGSDLHWFHGGAPPPAVCPGHEIAGEVARRGAAVVGVREGDRVAVEPLVVCRECVYCRSGRPQLCPQLHILGLRRPGGFADEVAVPAYGLFPLPTELDFALGALTEPAAVCVHAVRLAGIGLGDRVLVLGAGTIGLLGVLASRAAGARDVRVSARHPQQAAAARRLGATRVYDTGAEGERRCAEESRADPFDVVIETVGGSADTVAAAVRAVRPGGTVLVLGVFAQAPALPALALVANEVRLLGSMVYGRAGGRADFDLALDLLVEHREAVSSLITHRVPLAAVQNAFDIAADKRSGAIKVSVGDQD